MMFPWAPGTGGAAQECEVASPSPRVHRVGQGLRRWTQRNSLKPVDTLVFMATALLKGGEGHLGGGSIQSRWLNVFTSCILQVSTGPDLTKVSC